MAGSHEQPRPDGGESEQSNGRFSVEEMSKEVDLPLASSWKIFEEADELRCLEIEKILANPAPSKDEIYELTDAHWVMEIAMRDHFLTIMQEVEDDESRIEMLIGAFMITEGRQLELINTIDSNNQVYKVDLLRNLLTDRRKRYDDESFLNRTIISFRRNFGRDMAKVLASLNYPQQ